MARQIKARPQDILSRHFLGGTTFSVKYRAFPQLQLTDMNHIAGRKCRKLAVTKCNSSDLILCDDCVAHVEPCGKIEFNGTFLE